MSNKRINGEVSFIEYTEDGFNRFSKYLEVEYRPKCAIQEASNILNNFFMLDIKQSNDNYNDLLYNFFEILKKCKTDTDFDEVKIFFREISKIGLVGKKFYETQSHLISKHGLETFSKLEQTPKWQMFKQKKLEKIERINKQFELEKIDGREEYNDETKNKFLIQYQKINEQFVSFDSVTLKDEDKLSELINNYLDLQMILKILKEKKKIDDEELKKYNDDIAKKINYLKCLADGIDDMKKIWRH